jgi:hypothetical protein
MRAVTKTATTEGTVIHGTHRNQDLVPAFLRELYSKDEDKARELVALIPSSLQGGALCNHRVLEGMRERRRVDAALVRNITNAYFMLLLSNLNSNEDHAWWDSDDVMYLLEDLFDALNDHAPIGCYFGSHPGDGSDFGYWAHDEIETDILSGGDQ